MSNCIKEHRASLLCFNGILNCLLVFSGTNTRVSCINVKKIMNSIVNNQMSHFCGLIKHLFGPQNPFFNCVIVNYFSPFFFDHPVYKLKVLSKFNRSLTCQLVPIMGVRADFFSFGPKNLSFFKSKSFFFQTQGKSGRILL